MWKKKLQEITKVFLNRILKLIYSYVDLVLWFCYFFDLLVDLKTCPSPSDASLWLLLIGRKRGGRMGSVQENRWNKKRLEDKKPRHFRVWLDFVNWFVTLCVCLACRNEYTNNFRSILAPVYKIQSTVSVLRKTVHWIHPANEKQLFIAFPVNEKL